jgi:hypothetical protein
MYTTGIHTTTTIINAVDHACMRMRMRARTSKKGVKGLGGEVKRPFNLGVEKILTSDTIKPRLKKTVC